VRSLPARWHAAPRVDASATKFMQLFEAANTDREAPGLKLRLTRLLAPARCLRSAALHTDDTLGCYALGSLRQFNIQPEHGLQDIIAPKAKGHCFCRH
jgi:hypothetical protein